MGSVLYGNPSPRSPSAGTDGCYGNGTILYNSSETINQYIVPMATSSYIDYTTETGTAATAR